MMVVILLISNVVRASVSDALTWSPYGSSSYCTTSQKSVIIDAHEEAATILQQVANESYTYIMNPWSHNRFEKYFDSRARASFYSSNESVYYDIVDSYVDIMVRFQNMNKAVRASGRINVKCPATQHGNFYASVIGSIKTNVSIKFYPKFFNYNSFDGKVKIYIHELTHSTVNELPQLDPQGQAWVDAVTDGMQGNHPAGVNCNQILSSAINHPERSAVNPDSFAFYAMTFSVDPCGTN